MRNESTPCGPPELVREDGWRYRLDGVIGLDWEVIYSDERLWSEITPVRPVRRFLTVTVAALSDKTLDSIRMIRDEFTECSIRLQHDY